MSLLHSMLTTNSFPCCLAALSLSHIAHTLHIWVGKAGLVSDADIVVTARVLETSFFRNLCFRRRNNDEDLDSGSGRFNPSSPSKDFQPETKFN